MDLNNILYCCGYKHRCRVYCIGNNKLLQFTDECAICGNCIAQIVKMINGSAKIVVRKRGLQAIQLLQRYLNLPIEYQSDKGGTYANSLIYYNNRGQVYDFNHRRVGSNEDFCNVAPSN